MRLSILTIALKRVFLSLSLRVYYVCWYGNDSASSATNYIHKFICVLFLYGKKARAILDQIIAVAVPIILTIITAAQVRSASVRRRRVQNEWTWIYNLMYLYKYSGGGSRAKSRYCLILNQWHPFSFFDMDHWNDMPSIINKYLSICTNIPPIR